MDPVFTLQWPEFVVAHRLQQQLPKKDGYSLLIPLSRQEKAVDLAILKKLGGAHRTITIQIKASRTYPHPPPKRAATRRFLHYTWFRRFDVPADADFFLLLGMYAPDQGRTKSVTAKWYRDCTLLFTRDEMREFMNKCLTVGGQPDQMFGFGFDQPTEVFLTRGDQTRSLKDYSSYLLDSRIHLLRQALGA
jgi:hypothetical protein